MNNKNKAIRHLELEARKNIHRFRIGRHTSGFRGQDLEFFDLKEYSFTDDIKHIEWNVSTRTQKLHVKTYTEQRGIQFILALDISRSQEFSSHSHSKRTRACEIASLLTSVAHHNHNALGLCIFTQNIEKYLPPKKGHTQLLHIFHDILYTQAKNKRTSIQNACQFLLNVTKKRSLICLISDFIDTNYQRELSMLGKKHDVIAIQVLDPFEAQPPKFHYLRMQESESNQTQNITVSSSKFQDKYHAFYDMHKSELLTLCHKAHIDLFHCLSNTEYLVELTRFLKQRPKKPQH